jgi:galactonate dehydratase
MDPFDGFMSFTPRELDASVQRVQRVREAIGWDVDLAVDGHWRLLPMTAIAFAKEIEPLRILFFEEPCPSDNLDTLSELHAKINIPLAVGERYYTKWGFRPLLERQVVSFIQPDVCHVGGILECKKVAAMAEAQHVVVVPHNPNGPISSAVCAQVGACTPNFMMMESNHVDPWRNEFVTPPVEIVNGYIELSDRPGLGVELDAAACRRHAGEQKSFYWFKQFPW